MYSTHTAYYEEIKESVKTKTSIFLLGGLTINKFGMLGCSEGVKAKRSCVTRTRRAYVEFSEVKDSSVRWFFGLFCHFLYIEHIYDA
jgi:hypothetical protein